MINRTRCLFYEVKGTYYKDLQEAQKADLKALINIEAIADLDANETLAPQQVERAKESLADWLLKNAEEIAIILTTTPKSRRRKPRAGKGVPRKKKSGVAGESSAPATK